MTVLEIHNSSHFSIQNIGQLEIDGGVSEFAFVNINSNIVNANAEGGFEFFVN